MGLTSTDILDLRASWHTNFVTAKAVAVAAKGFNWQLLQHASTPPKGAACEAFFRRACAPNSQEHDSALMLPFSGDPGRAPNATADLATFMLIRGPFGWIGHDFVGCSLWDEKVGGPGELFERPPILDSLKVGTPLGQCEETESGVFERRWTRGRVAFDCASGVGSLNFTGAQAAGQTYN